MLVRNDTFTNIISRTISAHHTPLLHPYLPLNHTHKNVLARKHAKQHSALSYFFRNPTERMRHLNCSEVSAALPNGGQKRYRTRGPQKGSRDWTVYTPHFILLDSLVKSLSVFSHHRHTKSICKVFRSTNISAFQHATRDTCLTTRKRA